MSTRQEGKALRRLHVLIPTFECVPGCTDCCGPVPFSRWELEQLPERKAAAGLRCPYATDAGCSAYDQRPIMCRLFGAVDDERLTCPKGRRPEKLLTREEGERIVTDYIRWMPPEGATFL